ncbi:MAG: META domain-containing protein [Candidatus Promineifilaceae bacterium]
MNRTLISRRLLIIILSLLCACQTGPTEEEAARSPTVTATNGASLEGTEWRLLEIERRESDLIEIYTVEEWAVMTAVFSEGQLSGTTGCNHYSGPVSVGVPPTGEAEGTPALFEVGELAMTAAECVDPNLGRLQRMYRDSLLAADAYVVTADRLTILLPDGELRFRALRPDDLTAGERENEVVEALLAAWYGRRGDLAYVIQNETVFNAPGINLDETLAMVAAELDEPRDSELLADFRQKNAAVHLLAGRLDIAPPVTVLDEAEASRLLAGGWEAFVAQYPDAPAFITLSRVGFDETGNRALAYIGLRDETLAAGYYAVLTREAGTWVETRSFQLWEELAFMDGAPAIPGIVQMDRSPDRNEGASNHSPSSG